MILRKKGGRGGAHKKIWRKFTSELKRVHSQCYFREFHGFGEKGRWKRVGAKEKAKRRNEMTPLLLDGTGDRKTIRNWLSNGLSMTEIGSKTELANARFCNLQIAGEDLEA